MNCLLKELYEQAPYDFSLLLGLGHALELREESLPGIDDLQLHSCDVVFQPLLTKFRLIHPQKAGVYHEGPKAISEGRVHQSSGYTRVHTAAHSTDDEFPIELGHHLLSLQLREIVHVPLTLAANNVQNEVFYHLRTGGRVRHFRMKLNAKHLPSSVLHCGKLSVGCLSNGHEVIWQLRHLVAVAHPNWNWGRAVKILEESAAALLFLFVCGPRVSHIIADVERSVAELAFHPGLHLPAEHMAHFLQTIADAQQRDTCLLDMLPNCLVQMRSLGIVDGVWAPAQDDADRGEVDNVLDRQQARPEFAVNTGLTNATANQVTDLGSEVNDEDPVSALFHQGRHPEATLGNEVPKHKSKASGRGVLPSTKMA
mmetsp:Transcript_67671/g.147387  ORF Transcript_67671/g.147387 Transcript_67671/m.147387 type:complete len:369 (+) Transcript_67671:811-1917(+)